MERKGQLCTSVEMTSDVLRSCLTHAFITNSQEIAGLLLGKVEYVRKMP
jgi:hypothetical protein